MKILDRLHLSYLAGWALISVVLAGVMASSPYLIHAQQVGPGGVPGSGGGSGAVSSVFGRTGGVTAASGDYTAAQVTNAAATNATNTFSAAQTFTNQVLQTGSYGISSSPSGFLTGAYQALNVGTTNTGTGSHNAWIRIGPSAGTADTTGWGNIDIGYQAGVFRASGDQNIDIGFEANRYSSIGSGASFTAVMSGTSPNESVSSITIASGGTEYVDSACYQLDFNGSETSGAVGLACTNSSGVISTISLSSGGGAYNSSPTITVAADGQTVAIGYSSCGGQSATSTNYQSTCVGYGAGSLVGSSLSPAAAGFADTFIGFESGTNATYGQRNTCVGHTCLQQLTTGTSNTGVGRASLSALTTGSYDAAIGHASGYFAVSTSYDTYVGDQAGNSSSVSGGDNVANGQYNTFLGALAGITTGSSGASTNRAAIGAEALSGCNNCGNLGGLTTLWGVNNPTPQYAWDVNGAINTNTSLNINGVPIEQAATAPTGSCSTIAWMLSNDGHLSFCSGSGGTWAAKF